MLSTIQCLKHLPRKVNKFHILAHASEGLSKLGLPLPLNEVDIFTHSPFRQVMMRIQFASRASQPGSTFVAY